jgi:hypothetical protein
MQTLICGRSKVDTVRGGATRRSDAMRGADGMHEVLFTVAKLESAAFAASHHDVM